MSLFQKSVEKKYLNELDSALVDKKFNDFQNYFGNTEIQENIRNLKEEEFQEGFIRELFVNILNYTLKPTPEYNIVLEKKNVDDSRKADGAILSSTREHAPLADASLVIAVIELKSTSTANLDTVETQVFGYKNHHPNCVYVITSNFEKLRFYMQNAVDYLEFDLFNLSKEQFSLLWLCLSKNNILNDLPLRIKESSVLQEEDVTKKLYADYSKFKETIFENIVKNNPEKNELLLFRKTQKLLDRFLFIFFAEDKLLLQPNSISEIVKQWTTLKEELDTYIPLYDRFKKYFGYMNTGYKGKKYDIFSYNGGLFLPDEILDNITIDDNILLEHTVKLSAYDFETDVDVNILGHIFEHSLAEIENVQAKLRGEQIDKQKTKRKKDGIYYTPKYITKYIVENTVGKLCEEKRNELMIIDEEYVKSRKNRKKDTIKTLDKKLTTYREWLLSLTILDPACGSGAFLNQAIKFLSEEHKKIDVLKSYLSKQTEGVYTLVHRDYETKILEKNIYGVDLNEESVEIAKLSLWLLSAQRGRKLTSLNNNIKCGDSLSEDENVVGEKAFNWKKEFPTIFEEGGFDVIIGNPPYVVQKKDTLYSNYNWNTDLYLMFFELAFKYPLLKSNGFFGFITPRFFTVNKNCTDFRNYLLGCNDISLIELIETSPFKDAETECLITIIKSEKNNNDDIIIKKDKSNLIINSNILSKKYCLNNDNNEIQTYLDKDAIRILKSIERDTCKLNDISESKRGMEIGKKDFICTGRETLVGYDTSKFSISFDEKYVNRDNSQYLRLKEFFDKDDLIFLRRVSPNLIAAMSSEKYAFNKNIYGISIIDDDFRPEYILALLNSSLLNFYYKKKFSTKKIDIFPEIQSYLFKALPIKKVKKQIQDNLVELSDNIGSLRSQINKESRYFPNYVISQFELNQPSKKIINWFLLEFKVFEKEIKKCGGNINYPKSTQMEWQLLFDDKKKQIFKLQNDLESLYDNLDVAIFNIYNLSESERNFIKLNL